MPGGRGASLSVLAADAQLSGMVSSDGDLHIDGMINGTVVARQVTVGKTGRVFGTIEAAAVTIAGMVHGGVRASALHLSGTAQVYAWVAYDRLTREPGAVLEAPVAAG